MMMQAGQVTVVVVPSRGDDDVHDVRAGRPLCCLVRLGDEG